MNEQLDTLDKGIRIGAGLGGFIALRSFSRGTRLAGKGMYRRALKLRGKNAK